jgi:hypothetical protein
MYDNQICSPLYTSWKIFNGNGEQCSFNGFVIKLQYKIKNVLFARYKTYLNNYLPLFLLGAIFMTF